VGAAADPARASVVIDLAGGTNGGAGRFRAEYTRYAGAPDALPTRAIGVGDSLRPSWLVRREALARRSRKVVATNNVGFCTAGEHRWTLLRNANHFLSRTEEAESAGLLGASFALQVRAVRWALRRSDVLVVPSTSMADRVAAAVPQAADRLLVRHHPLLVPARRRPTTSDAVILCPVVSSPFKRLDAHLSLLAAALADSPVRVVCTTEADEVTAELRGDRRFSFIGMVDRASVDAVYDSAAAVYFPTSIESFGYPLAEARAAGMPVIAQETPHNREVAGPALFGYRGGDGHSLADAVSGALEARLTPDPGPFDPTAYFDWLLS
jgi:hypothetical protein